MMEDELGETLSSFVKNNFRGSCELEDSGADSRIILE
jgi:hypothetical protein